MLLEGSMVEEGWLVELLEIIVGTEDPEIVGFG